MSLMKCKVLLVFCNFLLLACGCILVVGGLLVLFDLDRVLLSKLLTYPPGFGPDAKVALVNSTEDAIQDGYSGKPPLFYGAIGCAVLGIFLVCIGTLGCWSSCLKSHCALTSYFLLVTTLLVGECAIFLIAWLWPHCLGLAMDSKHLVVALQKFYGAPGEEQFTAAVDLAQYTFRCCGIKNDKEYAQSVWKIKGYRPGFSYPLTCCKLPGEEVEESFLFPVSPFRWDRKSKAHQQYLDPDPINVTLCQDMHSDRPNGFRHAKGCGEDLERWFRTQYVIFLGSGLVIVLVEFSSLLSTVLVCSQIFKKATKNHNNAVQMTSTTRDNTYNKRKSSSRLGVLENVYEKTATMSTSSRKNRSNSQSGFQNGTYMPGMAIDDSGSLNGTLKA